LPFCLTKKRKTTRFLKRTIYFLSDIDQSLAFLIRVG
jgi:hypothetical protein